MPETDTPSPMKHMSRKPSTEVLRDTCFIKECGDALRHPTVNQLGFEPRTPSLKGMCSTD